MTPIALYLSKQKTKLPSLKTLPNQDLEFIVVIPCYNEPDLEPCLNSIEEAAKFANTVIEVIVIINDSELSSKEIKTQNLLTWSYLNARPNQVDIQVMLYHDLPHKKAGVGYARKLGMDEAAYRWELIGKPEGVICSMDADTQVALHYFSAIQSVKKQDWACLIIHFEHPLESIHDSAQLEAIIFYELHLRYYVNALTYAGFPHSYQTLGSALAVRASSYAEVGGMAAKQAGEDFYFIHKFSKQNKVYRLGTTQVYPSARLSDRVPFGTGKAMIDYLANKNERENSYAWQSILELRTFLYSIEKLYEPSAWTELNLSSGVKDFLHQLGFDSILAEIKMHTNSLDSFRKRLFNKMDAFIMMKYVHFMRDHYYPNESLLQACNKLLKAVDPDHQPIPEPMKLLEKFRLWDKHHADQL